MSKAATDSLGPLSGRVAPARYSECNLILHAAFILVFSVLYLSHAAAQEKNYVAVARGIVDVDGGIVQISSYRDGFVKDIMVQEGQHLKHGDPILVQDDRRAAANLVIAEAEVRQRQALVGVVEAKLKAARRERDRLVPVVQSKAAPQKSLDDIEAQSAVLAAELLANRAETEVALAKSKAAQYELDAMTIRAPSDGTIVRRLVRAGDGIFSSTAKPLFWFAPDGPIIVRADIGEQFANEVQVGQAAEIALETEEKVTFAGKLIRLGKAFGPRRIVVYDPRDQADIRVLEAVVSFDISGNLLRLGQRVIVKIRR